MKAVRLAEKAGSRLTPVPGKRNYKLRTNFPIRRRTALQNEVLFSFLDPSSRGSA
jgi:hypothetical protein